MSLIRHTVTFQIVEALRYLLLETRSKTTDTYTPERTTTIMSNQVIHFDYGMNKCFSNVLGFPGSVLMAVRIFALWTEDKVVAEGCWC